MKHERCPKCGGALGIPDKLRGQPVRCPVCKLEFVPNQTADSDSDVKNVSKGSNLTSSLPKPTLRTNEPATKDSNQSAVPTPKAPMIRGLPVPSSLKHSVDDSHFEDESDFDLPDSLIASMNEPPHSSTMPAPATSFDSADVIESTQTKHDHPTVEKTSTDKATKARLGTILPTPKRTNEDMMPPSKKYEFDDVAEAIPSNARSESRTAPVAKASLPTLKVTPPQNHSHSALESASGPTSIQPPSSTVTPPATRSAIPSATPLPTQAPSPSRSSRSKNSDKGLPVAALAKHPSPAKHAPSNQSPSSQAASQLDQQSVARIIRTENVTPQLTVDGKLPSLKLVDTAEPEPVETDWKSSPAILGLILCSSLVLSALMLLVAGTESASAQKAVDQAREKITQFYEIREDEELEPFQRELRSAQLAHSAEDYRAEIRSLQKVMARFHAEDVDTFNSLTGSPTWDIELQELISILMKDAKRKSRR